MILGTLCSAILLVGVVGSSYAAAVPQYALNPGKSFALKCRQGDTRDVAVTDKCYDTSDGRVCCDTANESQECDATGKWVPVYVSSCMETVDITTTETTTEEELH